MNKVYPAIRKSGHSSVRLVHSHCHSGRLILFVGRELARDSGTSQNEQYRGCRRFRRCTRLFEHPDRAGVRSVFLVCVYSACTSACVPSCNWFSMHREICYWHKGEESMENSCLSCQIFPTSRTQIVWSDWIGLIALSATAFVLGFKLFNFKPPDKNCLYYFGKFACVRCCDKSCPRVDIDV